MGDYNEREYKISINPRILELLGPSLYTNIYYVLAELIANAYDANAHNVYVIQTGDKIIVEDDGRGMSYKDGDIDIYLDVAVETRTTSDDVFVEGTERKRMGRKGIGKLAALSISDRVLVMTRKDGEESGFVLSRHVGDDNRLEALADEDILFEIVEGNGTSIVMANPQYELHKTTTAIKNNLLKIFPLVGPDFRVHVITDHGKFSVDSFDKEIIKGLGALLILGEEFLHLVDNFDRDFDGESKAEELLDVRDSESRPLRLKTKSGEEGDYDLVIKGWIGAYRTTRDRKKDANDFPDNFISLLSNGKLGEYNILPTVGQNKLQEVYVVGQLHVDLFEETELPDMALSNRQGYKTDDPRYKEVISFVRSGLLPTIVDMRNTWGELNKYEKNKVKEEQKKKDEDELLKKVEEYKDTTSRRATQKIESELGDRTPKGIKTIIENEMNEFMPMLGLKKKVDDQKKRILISQTKKDKTLADIVYKMLSFNNVPDEDIIYTNCDNEECRVPNMMNIFEYLRKFFVDSVSDKKMFVIYVTSDDMAKAWGAVTEVGAGWITQSDHDIFNIHSHVPQAPLNVAAEWQTSQKDGDDIIMNSVEFDKFVVKIMDICMNLGYKTKAKDANKDELNRYVTVA
ncbi:MAG: ATP-binding protein [Actinobacteria bacterium]|nr:ATP-binding protein [Actinomycetota bacterium]